MSPQRRSRRLARLYRSRLGKSVLLGVAALPLFQTTGCFPDVLGALNFELQSFVNLALISTVNVVVQNLLGL